MKRTGVAALAFFITIIFFTANSYACTSFAAYSQKTWYGMNFDHYIDDIRFSINKGSKGGIKAFSMDFLINGGYYPTVGMNSLGLFSSCQLNYPQQAPVKKDNQNQFDLTELFFNMPLSTGKVKDVRNSAKGRTLICQYNFVHTLFADSSGDAAVVETDNTKNWITDIKGKCIVMTNFFNKDLGDDSSAITGGEGIDRYMTAKSYIDAHIGSFSYNDGMAVLQNTIQSAGSFTTQCSMLFDPENAEVYIALKGDFSKVWKVSIKKGKIETFKGFDTPRRFTVGRGLTAKYLTAAENGSQGEAASSTEAGGQINISWVIFGIGVLLTAGAGLLLLVKKKKAGKAV